MTEDVVGAITDLTRVIIALQGNFSTKSEAIRRLHELSISSGRIAILLGMSQGDVASAIAKQRKGKRSGGARA